MQVEDKPKVQPKKDSEVDVPSESAPSKPENEEVVVDELAKKLDNLDDFFSSIPGVLFNRDIFIREALITAVDTVIEGVVVVVTGKEKLTRKLKDMMEFVEEA
jgi:hypothetical protein